MCCLCVAFSQLIHGDPGGVLRVGGMQHLPECFFNNTSTIQPYYQNLRFPEVKMNVKLSFISFCCGVSRLLFVFPTSSRVFLSWLLSIWASVSSCTELTLKTWSTWASPALCLNCRLCLPLTGISWLLPEDHRTTWTWWKKGTLGWVELRPALSPSGQGQAQNAWIKLLRWKTPKI